MQSTGVHVRGKPQLTNAAQPLKVRVIDEFEQQSVRHGNKTVHRVVENFPACVHPAGVCTKVHLWRWCNNNVFLKAYKKLQPHIKPYLSG
jgi:predicted metal-dependent phosphoesterase TrpH